VLAEICLALDGIKLKLHKKDNIYTVMGVKLEYIPLSNVPDDLSLLASGIRACSAGEMPEASRDGIRCTGSLALFVFVKPDERDLLLNLIVLGSAATVMME